MKQPWDIEPMHDAKDLFRIVQLRKVDRHYDEYTYEVFIASFVPRKYAQLLAHAPALLEALEGLLSLMATPGISETERDRTIQEARAAVRQARSES